MKKKPIIKKAPSTSYSRQLQEEIRTLLLNIGNNLSAVLVDHYTHINTRLTNIENSVAAMVTLGKKREEQMERTLVIHRLMLRRLVQVTRPLAHGAEDPVRVLGAEAIVEELEAELTPQQPWNDRRSDR